MERFAGLQYLCMEIKQGRGLDGEPEAFMLADTWLASAIEAASSSLRSLLLNFDLSYGRLHAGKMEDIVSVKMPNLRHLDINFVTTTEESFITALKDMPKLVSLFIAFVELREGSVSIILSLLTTQINMTISGLPQLADSAMS